MKHSRSEGDRKMYANLKPKIINFIFVFIMFSLVSTRLFAQNKGNFTITGTSSDWRVTLKSTGARSNMNCWGTDTYKYVIKKDGIAVKTINNGSNNLELNNSILNVGINVSNKWTVKYSTEGSKFSCLYWKNSNEINVATKSLFAPKSVSVTDSTSFDAIVNTIKISWAKGTDVPDNSHHYYIAKDYDFDNKVWIKGTEPRAWVDVNVNPGETHTYSIWTWVSGSTLGNHQSDTITVTGSTLSNFSASDGQAFSKTKIRIEWPELNFDYVKSLKIERDGIFVTTINQADLSNGQRHYDDEVDIPGFKHNYSLIFQDKDGVSISSQTDSGFAKPNGRIKGKVKAPFGGPVEGAIVYVERTSNIEQGEGQTIYSDTTNANGEFDIKSIYYFEEADFKVYPEKGDHGFQPATIDATLELQFPSVSLTTFIDTSSFTVRGNIVQMLGNDSAAVEGVEILVNDVFKGTITDNEGNFALTVEEIGEYTIIPRFLEHAFNPENKIFKIESDVTSVFFEDIEKDTLQGYFLGGCEIYIGQANLRVFNSINPTSALDTIITTSESTGYYEIILPSREYTIEVVDFIPVNGQDPTKEEIIDFFGVSKVDLSEHSIQKDFVFRKSPELEIIGFPDPGCVPYNVPIVEQIIKYPLEIKVFESFGEDRCLTSAGFVVIDDEVKDGYDGPDTLQLENGIARYDLLPGEPNILDGGEHPFQKLISIHANVEGLIEDVNQYVLVEGNRPREQTFATVSPEIPFMILRDPPGDGSYSFLSENTTTKTSMRLFSKLNTSVQSWGEVKIGNKTLQGMGVFIEQKFWAKIKASFSVGANLNSQVEFGLSISNETEFKTSGNSDITGESGDLFVGSAMNIIYALTDVIEYNTETCSVDAFTSIIMGNDGFNTTFMYTESHIRNVLIPDLGSIEDSYAQQGNDSSKIYRNQIEVWNQTLERNRELKEKALKIRNRSFSAGANFTSSVDVSTSASMSIEYSLFIEHSVATSAGLEIAGTGFQGGSEIRNRMEVGGSNSLDINYSRTTGFHLEDDDIGDFFSVDIKEDLVYGTPVFDLVSGRSSCPWELGTQPREGVQLTIDNKCNMILNRMVRLSLN